MINREKTMSRQHILIVEDEAKIAELLADYLKNAGYEVRMLDRGDGVAERVRKQPPDLILLDIMLPGRDGTEVCRQVRAFSRVPVIMLTARVEEIDRVLGLELGADDYICKPFSPREVLARVKAVLRRARPPRDESALMTAGPIELDTAAHNATVQDSPLDLTPSEFGLLKTLMAQPGRVFSRSELLDQVQGYTYEGYDRTVDTHVKNLRKKIADKLPGRDIIRTVYGVGYKFAVEAQAPH
jgi:two-component system, OmpR family, response regulator BaeR